MEQIKDADMKNVAYYIPHPAIYKPEALITMLRVIFSASTKWKFSELHFIKSRYYSKRSVSACNKIQKTET